MSVTIRSLVQDPLIHLLDHVYRGAVDSQAWPGIVEHVARFFDCARARLFTGLLPPERGGLGISYGVPEAALQHWAARYIQYDIWMKVALEKQLFREGAAVLDWDLVPEEEFVESIIYREHLHGLDIARLCSGGVFGPERTDLPATVVAVYRGLTEPRFCEHDRESMLVITPHLSRALGVMFRLRDAELRVAATLSALDRLASGVVLVGRSGAVLHANREARRVLDEKDGLTARPDPRRGGCPHFASTDAQTQVSLEGALKAAISTELIDVTHFSATVVVGRPSGRRPLVLQFAPLPGTNEFCGRAAPARGIVFISDPERAVAVDEAALRQLYQVTPAEARLAALLGRGRTLAEAALELRVSKTTVHTQLSSLFEKTGARRQSELLRLLAGLAWKDA
jgi:DNA-binding CsgD family transcriptional regulator